MSKKKTTEEFSSELNERFGDQFVLLSEYVNNHTKVDLLCKNCGNVISKRPVKMVSGKEGCYICVGKNHYKTKETLQKEVNERFPNEYVIIGEYIRAREPLLVKRIPCGHEFNISPDNLLRGKGCPRCSIRQSSYMDRVEKFMNDHDIQYEKEKRFPDCKSIRELPFDYFIPDYNMCIEVDGEFHYRDTRTGELSGVKDRDAIKTKFCEENGINLLRIPYFDINKCEEILCKALHVNTEVTV